ncbi:MAG: CapA family protein [Acidimicrobiaceae bacterium]|nr:CapA family protein [Acidimicrobiaceae bacterium]
MRRFGVLVAVLLMLSACSGAAAPPPNHAARKTPSTPTPSPTPTPVPQLTLSGLFHPAGRAPTGPDVRTLNATGDVIPARLVNEAGVDRNDFEWPFRPTASYVANADLTYINLESPLLAGCQVTEVGLDFCGDPRWTEGLKAIGTDVANLANNHVYPGPNTQATSRLLQANGIQVTTNLGPPVVMNVRGTRFAFVACNAVEDGPVNRAALVADIRAARRLVPAGVVVVQFHWGKEYERLPMPAPGLAPDSPVDLGHLAIDAGADLVLGNHPHWVQAVEIYKNHLIVYAHGNYVFDQVNCYPAIGPDYATYCSDDTRTSVIGTYTFHGTHLVGVTWKPTYTDTQLQTQFADPARAATVLQTMEQASDQLARQLGEPVS